MRSALPSSKSQRKVTCSMVSVKSCQRVSTHQWHRCGVKSKEQCYGAVVLLVCILFMTGLDSVYAAAKSSKANDKVPGAHVLKQISPCKASINGQLINLEPLQRTDGHPRFHSTHGGWNYTFNPCISYNEPTDPHGAEGDRCLYVAICKSRKVPLPTESPSSDESDEEQEETGTEGKQSGKNENSQGLATKAYDIDTAGTNVKDGNNAKEEEEEEGVGNDENNNKHKYEYYTVGIQRSAKFQVRQKRNATMLKFHGIRTYRRRRANINLICDPKLSEPRQAVFTVLYADIRRAIFTLRSKCCCPDGCLETVAMETTTVSASMLSQLGNMSQGLNDTDLMDPKHGTESPKALSSVYHMWLLLVVNVALLATAIVIGVMCCRKGGGNGPYNMLPALHASRLTINSMDSFHFGGMPPPLKLPSPDFLDYTSAKQKKLQIPCLENCMILGRDIEVGQRLGGGLFGDTYLADWKERTVAAKRITVGHQSQLGKEDAVWLEAELAYLTRQRHKNVITIVGLCLDMRQPYIIMEYVDSISLRDLLHKEEEFVTWPTMIRMCIQACDGMAFLHSAKPPILHRDLRCANLLVDNSNKVKVVDFGMTKLIQRMRQGCISTKPCYCKTDLSALPASMRWTAPEILESPTADEEDLECGEVFHPGIDIYSFGMVLWEIVSRLDPFEDIPDEAEVIEVVKKGGRPAIDEFTNPVELPQYADLAKMCWHPDRKRRPSFKQVTVHLQNILHVSSKGKMRVDSMTTVYLKSLVNMSNR